jgi:hypothetical protein
VPRPAWSTELGDGAYLLVAAQRVGLGDRQLDEQRGKPLPSSPWSPPRRMFTGTIAHSPWRGGSSPRPSSSLRSPPVAAHSTTPLTLPPSAERTFCS